MLKKKYQDYVIKDGKFIGDFEAMYTNCEDPWFQNKEENLSSSRRIIIKNWIKKINIKNKVKVCEIGCGYGHITSDLNNEGISCIGTDISSTAINKARNLHKNSKFEVVNFDDFDFYKSQNINIFLMAEITWYVLPKLRIFLKKLKEYKKINDEPIYLIHLLTTYPKGVQKYGKDYFFDLEGILKFFKLEYLESGYFVSGKNYKHQTKNTFFIAVV